MLEPELQSGRWELNHVNISGCLWQQALTLPVPPPLSVSGVLLSFCES